MKSSDTVELLKECDAGVKMAVASFDDVLGRVRDSNMKDLLEKSRQNHEKLGDEIHSLLGEHHSGDKDPNPVAKTMSWMKTTMKMGMDESDATVADLITDGCNMGVKSLHRYMNQYRGADETSRGICGRLVSMEENLCRDLQDYL